MRGGYVRPKVSELMRSFFSWMDYSEHERREALDIIDLFREQDTRDELGIGTVRDAFADLLFPGTSTIQTRARYFLFVPWIYLEMERSRVPSGQVAGRARSEEIALIGALMKAGDADGVIGKEVGKGLKRLPSNIYWLGLRTWKIRRFPGSQDQYHRTLDRFYQWDERSNPQVRNDDGEPVDGVVVSNWDAAIPPRPRDFPRGASLRLSQEEAGYLIERIVQSVPGTLLALLVERGEVFEPVRFPWVHPCISELPARLRGQLIHARNFSECMHGAALLYNLMLAELAKNQTRVDEYRRDLTEWSLRVGDRASDLATWDRRRFWEVALSGGARIPLPTRTFIDGWLDLALGDGDVVHCSGRVAANDDARWLIHKRERAIKRDRARLDNRRALELWSGAAGTAQLTYRWPVAQRIILDIIDGLTRQDSDV